MKKKIAILMGGISGERKISILTGKACKKALLKNNYTVKEVDIKKNIFLQLKKIKPYAVFNALHGRYGEDGFVQSILEYLKIPYTHSGVISSSLAMDKELSRKIFINKKIKVPKYFIFNLKEDNFYKKFKLNKLKFPIVIKPINEGSSLGVYICNNLKSFFSNLKNLSKYENIIIEQYLPGQDIQVAVMGKKALGAIELKPKRKFYDYKAKYFKSAQTKHIMPANISTKKYNEVLRIAVKAHKCLKCQGITRSDFIFYNNNFYLLELNTQPGMTELSLVPEIANFKDIKFDRLVKWIIEDASINR